MKFDLYTQKGKKATEKIEVSDSLVAGKVNKKLLAQYNYVYLTNQRESIAHTKDRSEITGGGKKPYKQKGTGNARAGSNRSPIWRSGAVTFGPRKEHNWKRDLPKKMRIAALRSALANLVSNDSVRFIDAIEISGEQFTKQAQDIIAAFGAPRKFTLLVNKAGTNIQKAFANVENAKVIFVGELNAYDLMNAGNLFIVADAVSALEKWA